MKIKIFFGLFKSYFQKFRMLFIVLIGISLLAAIAEGAAMLLLFPMLTMIGIGEKVSNPVINMIDIFFHELHLPQTPIVIFCAIIIAFLMQNTVMLLQAVMQAKLQTKFEADERNNLYHSLIHSRWDFIRQKPVGNLVNANITEMSRVGQAVSILPQTISATVLAAIYIISAFFISAKMTLALFVAGIIITITLKKLLSFSETIGAQLSKTSESITHFTKDSFSNIKMIKAMNATAVVEKQFKNYTKKFAKINFWVYFNPNLVKCLFEFTAIISLISILFFVVFKLKVNITESLVIMVLFYRLYPRLSNLQYLIQQFNINSGALALTKSLKQDSLLNQESASSNCKIKCTNELIICYKNVSVIKQNKTILSNINVEFHPGKITAVVGASGAGKSTLVECLLKFIPISNGNIEINNVELSLLAAEYWRNYIAYVSHEPYLLHMSIKKNICLGLTNIDDAQFKFATKTAGVDLFIDNFNSGYEEILIEQGQQLSAGQRQRIAIARALMQDKPILILDEAFSSLDAALENNILQSLAKLKLDKTIIYITHRLNTTKYADFIYVLANGELKDSGSYQQVIENNQHCLNFVNN